MRWKLGLLISVCVILSPGTAAGEEKDMSAPAAGRMRFSKVPDDFAKQKNYTFTASDSIYALVGFGRPWRELMKKADGSTSVVVKLVLGRKEFKHSFYPGKESFSKDTYVLDVAPTPEHATQFTYNITKALGALPPGKHALKLRLWSFAAASRSRNLAEGSFTFVSTTDGQKRLLALVAAIKEAKNKKRAPPKVQPDAGKKVVVRRDGSELLFFRGDEVVLGGAVVGKIEGKHVRKAGSIVGEMRGKTFRHEGADAWLLDNGNLYQGIEVRWNGAILGDIRKDGTIWREGSSWGSVKPYAGTEAETMRLVAALYYWSDFFKKN
jgi:hypothetical protein